LVERQVQIKILQVILAYTPQAYRRPCRRLQHRSNARVGPTELQVGWKKCGGENFWGSGASECFGCRGGELLKATEKGWTTKYAKYVKYANVLVV